MLQEFITSALIIDDKVNEIEGLEQYLESVGIWSKHYTPEMLNERTSRFNNRKLIFLDLFIDESDSTIEGNISKIRKYFEKVIGVDFGSYGIALWSKDPEKVQTFSDKIFNTGDKYTRPLFVVALDKTKYLRSNDFSNLLLDLESELSKDVSASFFVEWNKAVKKGSDETISRLYNLFSSNKKKKQHLEYILYKLARNYTGIPDTEIKDYDLQRDLLKSLMDTLQFEVSSSFHNIESLFSKPDKLNFNDTKEEKERVFSELNSLLMIDTHNLTQEYTIPGNIYELKDNQSPLYISSIIKKKKNKEEEIDLSDKINKRVVIEITPPCDFSQTKKQKQSRIIGGIILNYDNDIKEYFTGGGFYNDLYPISIKPFEKPQMIIFDFYRFQTIDEAKLKDGTNYEILMKAKDKLFADILQKLSSHTARLGIAVLYP